MGTASVISETIRFAVKKALIKRMAGKVLFMLLTVIAVALAIKVGLDFSSGSYSHTGLRFRMGVLAAGNTDYGIWVWMVDGLPAGRQVAEETGTEGTLPGIADDR